MTFVLFFTLWVSLSAEVFGERVHRDADFYQLKSGLEVVDEDDISTVVREPPRTVVFRDVPPTIPVMNVDPAELPTSSLNTCAHSRWLRSGMDLVEMVLAVPLGSVAFESFLSDPERRVLSMFVLSMLACLVSMLRSTVLGSPDLIHHGTDLVKSVSALHFANNAFVAITDFSVDVPRIRDLASALGTGVLVSTLGEPSVRSLVESSTSFAARTMKMAALMASFVLLSQLILLARSLNAGG